MKKFIVILLAVMLAIPAVSAFADQITANGTSIGRALFRPSAGVVMFAYATDTEYRVAAKHPGGEKGFWTDEEVPGVNVETSADIKKGTCSADITAVDTAVDFTAACP